MSNSTKICISCVVAALVLSLTDASQQTGKLVKSLPSCAGLAQFWNGCSDFLFLNQLTRAQRDCLKSSPVWNGQDVRLGEEQAESGGATSGSPVEEPKKAAVAEPEKPAPAQAEEPAAPEETPQTPKGPAADVTPEVKPGETPAPAEETPADATPTEPTPAEVPSADTPAADEPVAEDPAPDTKDADTKDAGNESQDKPAEETAEAPAEEAKEIVIDENAPMPNVKCKVMLVGDSLMQSLGSSFYKEWKEQPGLEFVLAARHSTGLTQPEYYNWPEHLDELLKKYRPDVIVVLMGGNDALPIARPKRLEIDFGSDLWKSTYTERVKEFHDVAVRNNCDVIWMGLPIVGGKMTQKLGLVRQMQQEGCKNCGITFVDNVRTLADSKGQFQTYGKGVDGKNVRLRRKDMIHMTKEGDELLVRAAKKPFGLWLRKFAKTHPGRCMGDEEAKTHQNPKILVPSI